MELALGIILAKIETIFELAKSFSSAFSTKGKIARLKTSYLT
jgi:hypothetical protein